MGAPLVADFDATPLTGAAPLVVDFTDRSTGSITGWTWSFGDGITDATQNAQHTFATAGTYTVFLTVTGPGGNDTKIRQSYITVTAGSATAPTFRAGGGGGGGGCAIAEASTPSEAAGALLPLLALVLAVALARRRSA
jgi:uncharacterized protein (TIGR03382 family)